MPTPALATLEQVKSVLGIDSSDTSRDAALTIALATSEAVILRLTRYTLEDAEVTAEVHENVREGDLLWTALRPISDEDPATVVGRLIGSDSFSDLVLDVVDHARGRVRVVGVSAGLSTFPPLAPVGGLLPKRRRYTWPVTQLGYSADAIDPIPAVMTTATIAYVAFLDTAGLVGTLTAETVGAVSESYGAAAYLPPFPTSIRAMLGNLVEPVARLARG